MFKQIVTDYKYACIALRKEENKDDGFSAKEVHKKQWHCDRLAGEVLKACQNEGVNLEQLRDRLGKRFREFEQFYNGSSNWCF